MRLSDVLTVERVRIEDGLSSKTALLRALARLFTQGEGDSAQDVAYQALLEREKLASTGVGSGVAIPHGRVSTVEEVRAALIICRTGVDFAAIDGAPVHIVLGILTPERHSSDHLKALARASRLLRDERVRDTMVQSADAQTLCAYVLKEDSLH